MCKYYIDPDLTKCYAVFLFPGGMAEWLKAAVLKTVERKLRGFESYSLRQEIEEKAHGLVKQLASFRTKLRS